jgi:hypothetical protein
MVKWQSVPAMVAFVTLVLAGCAGDNEPEFRPPTFQGLTVQKFPVGLGATWSYQNTQIPEERYRIEVVGTRIISSAVYWTMDYRKLDALGAPTSDVPEPTDFYAANGLHMRLGALTRIPGVFARAVFVAGVKAAAVEPFPVKTVFARVESPQTLDPLDPDQRLPLRYDEMTRGTEAILLEGASEGVLPNGSTNFQKHLPPRRFWEFPMRKGSRWTVFFTNEIDRGPTSSPQPPILAERRVADDAATVETPAYTGPSLLVEEWVTGLRKGEDGELQIPSLDDTDGDGTPQRGAPTARYWVAPGYGVVKYEYEYVTLVPVPAFTRKTYVLTAFTAPTTSDATP